MNKRCQNCKYWYFGSQFDPPHCMGEECQTDELELFVEDKRDVFTYEATD